MMASGSKQLIHCEKKHHQLVATSDDKDLWDYRNSPRNFETGQEDIYRLNEDDLGEGTREAHETYFEDLPVRWLISREKRYTVQDPEGVSINVDQGLSVIVADTTNVREWTFSITTKEHLDKIILLDDVDRQHFCLLHITSKPSGGDEKTITHEPGSHEWNNPDDSCSGGECQYTCKVRFNVPSRGTYSQCVAFEFLGTPTLIKKLKADVIPEEIFGRVLEIRENMMPLFQKNRTDHVQIIPLRAKSDSGFDKQESLNYLYYLPENSSFISHAVSRESLNKNNYVARQHQLLFIEELARRKLISRYNCIAEVVLIHWCRNSSQGDDSTPYATHFAHVGLAINLSEEFGEAKQILSDCDKVLIALSDGRITKNRKVHEASIVKKGESNLVIRVSEACVQDLHLRSDMKAEVELQFQLKPWLFLEMHLAVDRLHFLSVVLPDRSEIPTRPWKNKGDKESPKVERSKITFPLSFNQTEAVLTIGSPASVRLPPILIAGPFGSGKTLVLFEAAKFVLQDPGNRVLICTRTNSAADSYITEYFHPYVCEGHEDATPLRLYHFTQKVEFISPVVTNYCMVQKHENFQLFEMPKQQDILMYRVVISNLRTTRHLFETELERGFFTHIFIDDAHQPMECEALIPLGLATEHTRIVLAGDLDQSVSRVYTSFARKCGFDKSLLRRLWDWYKEDSPCKILLRSNYSSPRAIVNFASEMLYGYGINPIGEHLEKQNIRPFPLAWIPVTDVDNGHYYQKCDMKNQIATVVRKIEELRNSWGELKDTDIAVLTPFNEQVIAMKSALRKNNLGAVYTGKVSSIEGRHFRVVFLSAIGSCRTCCTKGKKYSLYDLDYSFISKLEYLLLTTTTKAQSLIVVVGTPNLRFCSSGRCKFLWENFISRCQESPNIEAKRRVVGSRPQEGFS